MKTTSKFLVLLAALVLCGSAFADIGNPCDMVHKTRTPTTTMSAKASPAPKKPHAPKKPSKPKKK